MVERDLSPEAGGNTEQWDDGRDELGRLPEPIDSANWVPGGPTTQPAGTGPVVSSPVPLPPADDEEIPAAADDAPAPDAEATAEGGAPTKKTTKAAGGMTTMPRAGG